LHKFFLGGVDLVASTARGLNFIKLGGLHEKHAVETWEPPQDFLEDRGKPTEIHLHNTQQFSPYLTGNSLHLRYKAQPVNAV
jgi:hypothetical protein